MSNLVEKLVTSITNVFNSLAEYAKKEIQNEKEYQVQFKNQIRNYELQKNMNLIREELSRCFKDVSYPCLKTVGSLYDIHTANYFEADGKIIYQYKFLKASNTTLLPVTLSAIAENMNQDICRYAESLSDRYPPETICIMHPAFYNGLYVLGAQDCGDEVIIAVTTHWKL